MNAHSRKATTAARLMVLVQSPSADRRTPSCRLSASDRTDGRRLVDRFAFRMIHDVLDLLGKGMLSKAWLDKPVPFVVNHDDHMLVVHSIVPYVPKRAQEE